MLLKIITPFDIIEDGVSVTHYEPGVVPIAPT